RADALSRRPDPAGLHRQEGRDPQREGIPDRRDQGGDDWAFHRRVRDDAEAGRSQRPGRRCDALVEVHAAEMRDRMTKLGYTTEYKIETMARAYGRDLPLAWKKSVELARQLRGRTVEKAREYLENVAALKQAVPMRTYGRWVAHKSGLGPARYPVKAAKAFLTILESAVANAEFTGKEDPDTMVIAVINAHKGATSKGYRPRAYGRSSPWNQDTVNLEI